MKQRIAAEQLNELTDEQIQKLRDLWNPEKGDYIYITHTNYKGESMLLDCITEEKLYPCIAGYVLKSECLPLLSIVQMIELIGDGFMIAYFKQFGEYLITFGEDIKQTKSIELADALWEAVKQIL